MGIRTTDPATAGRSGSDTRPVQSSVKVQSHRRHVGRMTLWVGVALFLAGLVHEAHALDWGTLKKNSSGALVLVHAKGVWKNGLHEETTGTAFIFHPLGYALTCAHVVPAADPPGSATYSYVGSVGDRYSQRYPIEVIDRKPDQDLALIKLPSRAEGWPTVQIDFGGGIKDSMPLYAIGFPGAASLDGASGEVRREMENGLWEITAPINPGNSGGPVFSQRGKVVGLASSSREDVTLVNVMIPVSRASGLIAMAPARQTPESETDPSKRPLVGKLGWAGMAVALGGGAAAGYAVGHSTEPSPPPTTQPVTPEIEPNFSNARFRPNTATCPDGANNQPLLVTIDVDAIVGSTNVTFIGATIEMQIVGASMTTSAIGAQTADGEALVSPGILAVREMNVLTIQSSRVVSCSNTVGGELWYVDYGGARVTLRARVGDPPSIRSYPLAVGNSLRINHP